MLNGHSFAFHLVFSSHDEAIGSVSDYLLNLVTPAQRRLPGPCEAKTLHMLELLLLGLGLCVKINLFLILLVVRHKGCPFFKAF